MLMGLITLMVVACSGDGANNGKKDGEQQHKPVANSAPQGQWVWVPGGDEGAVAPRYPAPVPPASGPGYDRDPGYGQRGIARPAPEGNPWAVPQYDGGAPSANRWDVPPQPNRWQPPAAQPRFRPLEEERPAYTREVQRPARNSSPWQPYGPYDRPYGSSANPNAATPYGGYPGYGYGYGGYPSPGGWPGYGGGYGGGWPMAGGLPGLWPGVW